MNKYQDMTKQTIRMAIVAAMIVAGAGAVYAGISMAADSVETARKEAEDKLNADSSTLSNLESQITKSAEADKNYGDILTQHSSQDFTSNLDALTTALSQAKGQYHFGQFNLTPVDAVATDNPALLNFKDHTITVRSHMNLTVQAVTDVHIFSFLDDFVRNYPGFIRIDRVELKRRNVNADLDDVTLVSIRNGALPMLVDCKIEFSQIGVNQKETSPTSTPGPGGRAGLPFNAQGK